jgi:mannose-6-phosphate isomerase-like protein (cupin superfamily)
VKLQRPTTLEPRAEFEIPSGLALCGVLEFASGTRLPLEGTRVHEQDEISFILSGKLEAHSGSDSLTLQAGDISFIPALEHHWAVVLEDTRLAYVLIPRTEGL